MSPPTASWHLWAPRASRVELVLAPGTDAERRVAAHAAGAGHWTAAAPPPGADYAVSVDGGAPFPDPTARSWPHGVHGASRAIEAEFPWTDAAFRPRPLASGLVYEIHVGTFSPEGTFDGAIARLDPLVELGVTHVELMPVAQFPGARGWGYDGVGLYAVQHSYGGLPGLQRFVDACHARGLAVLLDVVYNHLGPDGNYLHTLGPYFTERHRTPWGAALDFDGPESGAVRRFFIDNAIQWLRDAHVDGLRLDATHAIVDDSTRHVLGELADEVAALAHHLRKELVLIAENEHNAATITTPTARGGWGLDAFWYDDLHHVLHASLTGERRGYYEPYGRLADLETVLTGRGAHGPGERALGPASGQHLVACIQNHDQIGNRPLGERLGALVSPGQLRLAAAVLLTSPFVPLLFQGEEWAASTPFLYFTDHESPELGRAVSEGRRQEHAAFVDDPDRIPDPQAPETMARSTLRWDERAEEPHRSVLAWYRALIALRQRTPALLDGRRERVQIHVDEDARTVQLRRGGVTLLGNVGATAARLPAPPGAIVIAYPSPPVRDGDVVVLAPDGVAIWSA